LDGGDDGTSAAGGLRFHWRLPLAGEEPGGAGAPPPGVPARALPDYPSHLAFCRLAEQHGIDSLLMACGFYMPDPVPLVAALGTATRRIRFMLAYRSGLIAPTAFVQQVNTLAALTGGRVSLNMVVGHSQEEQRSYGDFLSHDERYQRSDEFLTICRAFWRGGGPVDFAGKYFRIEGGRLGTPFVSRERQGPEIYLGGGSPLAREIAARHADCWLRLGDAPEKLRDEVAAMRALGVEVGIRLSLIARPSREEAVDAAGALLAQGDEGWVRKVFVSGSDSEGMRDAFARAADAAHWPLPYLWTGAVASRGPSAVCLVGTPEEIADAILDYRRVGVTQIILSSWGNHEAVTCFGNEILPLVRRREQALAGEPAAARAGVPRDPTA
jgi:alkanesulfonate monooxygenase